MNRPQALFTAFLNVFSACSAVLVSPASARYLSQASASRAQSAFLKLMQVRRGPSIVVSSELTVTRIGKCSQASDVATDQSHCSAMSMETKLMSGEADRLFVSSRVASFSLRMLYSATSISSASCSPFSSSFVFVFHQELCALIFPTICDNSLLLSRFAIDAL